MPSGAYGDEERGWTTYRLGNMRNLSNWVYKPGTKRPDFRAQNPHSYQIGVAEESWVTSLQTGGGINAFPAQDLAPVGYGPIESTALTNEALARFNGKLRKGSASLGVTLASWAQSREMIVKRLKPVGDLVEDAYKSLRKYPAKRRSIAHKREPLANQVLETEFGWKPLFDDVRAALTTVCQDGVPTQYVKGRAKGHYTDERSFPSNRYRYDGPISCTVAASVTIDNPNLWLLNRMGLINPLTVAWDLVPWSFVVNMFVNCNQMISSVSDEVGLIIGDRSTTYSSQLQLEYWSFMTVNGWFTRSGQPVRPGDLIGYNRFATRTRTRSVGAFPAPSWQVKVPQVNWELAVIASSLLVQKAKRLNNLIKVI